MGAPNLLAFTVLRMHDARSDGKTCFCLNLMFDQFFVFNLSI